MIAALRQFRAVKSWQSGCASGGLWLVLATACAAAAEPAAPPPAEPKPANWKELRLPEPEGGIKKAENPARSMLRDGQLSDQKLFDAYWRYFLSQITWYSHREYQTSIRAALVNQLKRRSGQPQQRLVRQIALPLMRDIARDEGYDKTVRYNALLILGELNQTEPDPPRLAVGLADTVPILLTFLDPQRSANDTNDTLRVGALCALERQAKRGAISEAALRDKATKAFQQILEEKTPPQGRDADVHHWIAQRAQDALSAVQPTTTASRAAPVGR